MLTIWKEQYIKACAEYDQKRKKLEEKIGEKQEEIKRLEKQIENLRKKEIKIKHPSWVDFLVKPLAEALAKELNLHYDIYGPFGLRAEISIYFFEDPSKSITEQPTKHLTLVPGNLDKGELYYETGKIIKQYPPESIAALNGMGREILPLPDTIDEILPLVR